MIYKLQRACTHLIKPKKKLFNSVDIFSALRCHLRNIFKLWKELHILKPWEEYIKSVKIKYCNENLMIIP